MSDDMPPLVPPVVPEQPDQPDQPDKPEQPDQPQQPAAEPMSAVCPSCGAQTSYAPATTSLRCGSCGFVQDIAAGSDLTIREHSLDEWMQRHGRVAVATLGAFELQCQNCGARTESTDLAGACQFCNGALVSVEHPEGLVEPEAVVPFKVDRSGARESFGTWVRSRRFAPNALRKVGSTEGLRGTYLPHWTYDAQTATDYSGQRGDYYYVTRTRTVSDGKGGSRTETYQERRTRWRPASGHVSRAFDDVVVVATHHLERKQLEQMGPWQLSDAKPFQAEYLTGYSAVRYDVDPKTGSDEAREHMRGVITDDVQHDIGGDEQRVSDMDVSYSQAMFKLILMPLWIATYLYQGKTYQVLVNANTGEVVGDRPYSAIKIALAVLAALIVIGAIVAAVLASR